jgi:fermentation-respiration switch protein FrsA (DUF1100 family)
VLNFDPAKVVPRIKQPMLIIHGGADVQVPPHHAARLAALAKARKNSPPLELKQYPSLNHRMVETKTGGTAADPLPGGATVSRDLAAAIATWLSSVAR